MAFVTDSDGLQFEFNEGAFKGTRWNVAASVCEAPTCACTVLQLILSPVHADGGQSQALFEFDVDIRAHERVDDGDHPAADLGRAFVAELSTKDWYFLEAIFHEYKLDLYEKADLTTVEYDFPFEQIEYDGLLIRYNEVFPFHNRPVFDAGGRTWLGTDTYCLRPECPCSESVVAFSAYPQNVTADEISTVDELFAVTLDLKTGTWRLFESYDDCPVPMAEVVDEFVKTLPLRVLKERQLTLRTLYKHCRPAYVPDPGISPFVRDEPKVGRNAPCPCGSGKKFKKCCGRG